LEDALAESHLDHNLGLYLRLCAFRFHHLPHARIYRHEYEQKPLEMLHGQVRLGQGMASGRDQHKSFVKKRDGEETEAHIESIGEEASKMSAEGCEWICR
jgi:hypothetical protein